MTKILSFATKIVVVYFQISSCVSSKMNFCAHLLCKVVSSYKVVCHTLPLHLASKFIQISLSFLYFKIWFWLHKVLLVSMAFKAPNSVKRKPLVIKCENLKKEHVTKRKKEKLVKVNHTLGCSKWTITDFASKLKLQVEGPDPHKNLSSFPTSKELVFVFGKR
jgi:hypothetical protein